MNRDQCAQYWYAKRLFFVTAKALQHATKHGTSTSAWTRFERLNYASKKEWKKVAA